MLNFKLLNTNGNNGILITFTFHCLLLTVLPLLGTHDLVTCNLFYEGLFSQ